MSRRPPIRAFRKGFTLVEVLVAVTILVVLLGILTQIVGYAGRNLAEGKQRADNHSKARALLDVFAADVRAGVFRPDLAAFPATGGGFNVAFYTKREAVGAAANDRLLSVVAYRHVPASASLERGGAPIPWTTPPGFNNTAATDPAIPPGSYQEIASGVVAMAVYLLDKDGYTIQAITPEQAGAGGAITPGSVNARAVGIALAVVDETAFKQLDGANQLGALAAALGAQGAIPAKSYTNYWNERIAQRQLDFANFPASVGTGLKFFERVIPLP